jgi:hypothetical protein
MRRCRFYKCRKSFFPEKCFYFYCSWECRVADVGPNYEHDYRGHQRSRDEHYDRGFWDGTRAKPPGQPEMPPHIWKALAVLVHPDRWDNAPVGINELSHEAMIWLLDHRPLDAERN